MKYYLKQHIFTWGDRFSIYAPDGSVAFGVQGEVFTFGKKLHLYDSFEHELAFIEQQIFTFLHTYNIYRGNAHIATVKKEFTFFTAEYSIPELGWKVRGDFLDRTYDIYDQYGNVIAQVYREWFTLGDAYAIDIESGVDPVNVLAVAVIIDAVISDQRN